MKKKDLPKIIIIAIVILFVIPLLINLSFKIASIRLLAAEWTAGDLLSFYGAVLGAVITLIGLFFTLDYQSKQGRKDDEIKYKPILRFNSMNNEFEELMGRQEVIVSFPFGSSEQKIKKKSSELDKRIYEIFTKDLTHFHMVLKNKGRGEATKVSLDKAVLKNAKLDKESHLYIKQSFPVSLGEIIVDETVDIDIVLPNFMFLKDGISEDFIFIELEISYDDIFQRNRTTIKTLFRFKVTPKVGYEAPYYKEGFKLNKVKVEFMEFRQI
ncbi:hypothetical protein [Streptococcus sanguinis]|jgi:hypothetical protein|uniref:Uncharacterized protein n=1 Tax=Streptococcus sanguinis TaxID=1305 RepID=A0AAJ5NHL9_STRSA|nr:hypothetical protein [Streptococcus sanguinis]VDY71592.1 Uncharacterised protein [Streptococcus sanguinis]